MTIAPIETLPVELLQPIYLAAGCNVALLKASVRLQVKLSSEYVYNATCDAYLTEFLNDRAAQSEAQTYMFATKWMTWAFFKSWLERRYEPNGCLCGKTPGEGCFDPQWPPEYEDATKMVFSRSHLPQIAFVKGRLPKHLLRGLWTQDKTQFLRFLLWITSMTVDWNDPEARKTALKGREQAMLEQNLEAVELFNHNRRLGKVANDSTLRFAVLKAGCDRSIVYDILLTASMWGTHGQAWECPELDRWCQEAAERGDPKGKWLRTKLEELRNSDGQPLSSLENPRNDSSAVKGLNPASGDYNGGPEDRLVVNTLEWNKVSILISYIRRLLCF